MIRFYESSILGLILICDFVVESEKVDWNEKPLVGQVNEVLENILGYSDYQNFYDTLIFKQRILNGSQLIQRITNNLGQKFFDRNNVIRNLRKAVKKSISDNKEVEECCELDTDKMEFDNRFKQKIGKSSCERVSSMKTNSPTHLSLKFEEACAKNLADMPSLRWQYFGSESGVTTQYPATTIDDCGSYDARFRPFYVQANVPEPKDVVIVIDMSGSMDDDDQGDTLLINIAKEAAKTVVSTLNPHDRVAVFGFSNEIKLMKDSNGEESCFSTKLAKATTENTDAIKQFISEIWPGGSTHYGTALERAFDYFDNTPATEGRDRVILFLSDGEPTDFKGTMREKGKYILNILNERNQRLNNSVVLMTYGLGSKDDFQILHDMARQDGSSYGANYSNPENVKTGLFTHVKKISNLRQELASYYIFFSKPGVASSKPIWSLPYLDQWGIGILISVALPVYDDNGHVIGVVGTDITMDDLLSGAVYFRPSAMSYIFVIDSAGFVIYHPLFKYSQNNEVKYMDIFAFESDPEMKSVVESMKSGGSGSRILSLHRTLSAGSNELYGSRSIIVDSEVHWKQIPHTSFSVCIILPQGGMESTLQRVEPHENDVFLYHRLDMSLPSEFCSHYGKLCAMNQSAVFFGPMAFQNPDQYLDRKETVSDVESITKHIMTGKGGSILKPGLRNSVWATIGAEKHWKQSSDSEIEKYVLWRYVGTKEGILRIFPGTVLPKKLDPVKRNWYRNALSHKGKTAFSIPYKDAASGEMVITMSKAIFEGRSSQSHNPLKDEVVAVMGADIFVPYLIIIMKDIYPYCSRTDEFRCFLIDSAGFVIADLWNISDFSKKYPPHITETDPFVAETLISNGILIPEICTNVNEIRTQRTYKILEKEIFEAKTLNDCYNFRLISIPQTNVYMIASQIMESACSEENSPCLCASYTSQNRQCILSSSGCECPCSTGYTNYNECNISFSYASHTEINKPCVPATEENVDFVTNNEENLEDLPQCTPFQHYTPSPPDDQGDDNSASFGVGAIVGVVIGVIVVLIILVIIAYFVYKHVHKSPPKPEEEIYVDPLPVPRPDGRQSQDPLPPPPYQSTYMNFEKPKSYPK